ncbi:MAG: MFS transporter [Gammaproteobacteria bacterium]|nr:MFS transporter [Gammaproteobacteria bacterium]
MLQPYMRNQISIFPILSVNFIGTLGYSIVMPFLIFLVAKFGGNAVIFGILGATYSAFQLIGAPILGRYSDIYGRKPILLISQIGTLLAWLLFLAALMLPNISLWEVNSAWAGEFTLTLPLIILFIGRALDGATGGNISVANAYLVDISTEENRKSNFGKMAASSNLGFIIGPVLAGLLGATALGEIAPTLAATFISFLAVFVIVIMLPDQEPTNISQSPCANENQRRVSGKEIKDCFDQRASAKTFRKLLGIPAMPLMLVLYFLIFLAFALFYTAFPIHAATGLGWEMNQLGIYFSVLSLAMILIQGPVMTYLSPRVSEKPLVVIGSLVMFASFVLLNYHDMWLIYTAAILFAIGNGIMWPSFLSLLGQMGEPGDQGYIQGIASSAGSLASIAGLVIGGFLYSLLASTSFVIAAGVFIVVFVLAMFLPGVTSNQ